jgi:protein-L-isoaspartate(D-aspartate) O-methyltransferase
MNYEQARFNMIEQQIRPWEVLDQTVLQLLALVKREDFVPLAHKALAFIDMEIPIGEGQSMLAPKVEARILQDLNVHKHEKVLEIGSGSGYVAALLGHRAQRVISIERIESLAAYARERVQRAGVHNVEIRHADGAHIETFAADGPFDVIVLSGSVAQVPQELLSLLKPGGRLAAIVGDEPVMRFTLASKASDGSVVTSQPWDTLAPRLVGFAETPKFSF